MSELWLVFFGEMSWLRGARVGSQLSTAVRTRPLIGLHQSLPLGEDWPADVLARWHERAGIMEFDGCL